MLSWSMIIITFAAPTEHHIDALGKFTEPLNWHSFFALKEDHTLEFCKKMLSSALNSIYSPERQVQCGTY